MQADDQRFRPKSLTGREGSNEMKARVRKAVFPAAGLGTRFLPATKALPKEMLALVDKPLIQYGVEEAIAAGCEQIIIVTGRNKAEIEDHFDISFELEQLLEKRGKTELLAMTTDIPYGAHRVCAAEGSHGPGTRGSDGP
jgi:UTP-glucose-1-phosphate uridylyltransferase